jgi:hypothetical protein
MNGLTDYLYARPSFLEGCGRVLDFGDTLTQYNTAVTAEQADLIAAYFDWLAVGNDLRAAVSAFDHISPSEAKGATRGQTK